MDLGTSCRPWPLQYECWAFVVDPPVLLLCLVSFVRPSSSFLVSFVLPLGFGFVISFGLFLCPLGLLAWGGITSWIRGYP